MYQLIVLAMRIQVLDRGDLVNTGLYISETTPYLLTPWSRVLLEKLTVNFAVLRLRDTSSRNTPPWRSEWGSSLPPDCFVSRGSISTWVILNIRFFTESGC
jgi:hypothetical protein